jgi:hypothetical protein
MASAIEKLKYNARMSRVNQMREVARYKHTVFSTGTAAVLGFAEAKGKKLPPVIPGLEGEVTFGMAALFLSSYASGDTGRVLQSLADAMLAVGMYKIGKRAGVAGLEGLGAASDAHAMDALLSAAAANMAG